MKPLLLFLWAGRAPLRGSAIAATACFVLPVAYGLLRSHALVHPLWQPAEHVRDYTLRSIALVLAMVMVPIAPSLSFHHSLDTPMCALGAAWLHLAEDLSSVLQYHLAGLYRPRLLVLGLLWKVSIWPLTGFALVTPHYLYIARLGDGLLYGCAAAQIASMLSRLRRPTQPAAPDPGGA